MNFAAHGLFNAFAGFQKTRQRRIIAGWKAGLPSDQRLAFKFGEHDDHRVGPREMLFLAIAAFAAPACAEQHRRRAAAPTETMAIMPFDQAACRAVNRRVPRRQRRQGTPDGWRTKRIARCIGNGYEIRLVVGQAKQDEFF